MADMELPALMQLVQFALLRVALTVTTCATIAVALKVSVPATPTRTQQHAGRGTCTPTHPPHPTLLLAPLQYFSVSAQRGRQLQPIDVLKGICFSPGMMAQERQVHAYENHGWRCTVGAFPGEGLLLWERLCSLSRISHCICERSMVPGV